MNIYSIDICSCMGKLLLLQLYTTNLLIEKNSQKCGKQLSHLHLYTYCSDHYMQGLIWTFFTDNKDKLLSTMLSPLCLKLMQL